MISKNLEEVKLKVLRLLGRISLDLKLSVVKTHTEMDTLCLQ